MNRPAAFALALLLGAPLLAQPRPTPPPAATAPEPSPDPAVLKAMKSQVFVVRYADPLALLRLINPLRSGVRGTDASYVNEPGIRALSVRDFPENLATIGEVLARLDVPATARSAQDADLLIQVLFASPQPGPEADLPADLQPVLKGLRSTLGFRSYVLAASLSQRVRANEDRSIQGQGQIEGSALGLGTPKEPRLLRFEWRAGQGLSEQASPDGPAHFSLRNFQFQLRDAATDRTLADLETGLTLDPNEHVVVGTSVVKGRGVIVVLSIRSAR